MNLRKLRIETLEERALLAVVAGGVEQVAVSPAPTGGTTWVVNTVEDPTEWDPTDDILSLREAISCTVEGDTIKFDPTLSEGWIILNGNQLEISEAITIDASETGGITLDANVKNRIFYVSGGTADNPVELIGLNIIGGDIKSGYGGGIYNTGSLRLTECTVLGNTGGRGGGIANCKTLNMIDCTVLGNYGNGILNTSNAATLNLTNCIISENSDRGIYNYLGAINLSNTDVTQNTGNGIDNNRGRLELSRCNIFGNSGYGISIGCTETALTNCNISGNSGGILYSLANITGTIIDVTVSMKECIIVNNTSSQNGGGVSNYGNNSFTLTNCTISRNTAKTSGGGLYNTGTLALINCVISENKCSSYGSGIYSKGTLRLTNCSVVKNSMINSNSGTGGGVYKQGLSYFFNSIILLNGSKSGADIYNASDSTYAYNTISTYTDWTASSNCPEYDSDLPLFIDAENGNYDLPADSQAVNKGKNSYIFNYPTDVTGNERISGEIVDIGAYEYQFEEPPAEPLNTPSILTGGQGVYVSAGANRHQITWTAVENASGYELTYSSDNSDGWTSVITPETSTVITGLTYGDEVSYRVRALGKGSFADSEWSEGKTFVVCPIDINGDGDISNGDRAILGSCWLTEEGEDDYVAAADIDGDGDVSNGDRQYLSSNWLSEVGDEGIIYPRPLAADLVFAEYESADLEIDLAVF